MTTETPVRPTARRTPERVEPGAAARARMPDADYADAFRIGSALGAPAGAWARQAFEGLPAVQRRLFGAVVWGGLLGMHLAPDGTPGHISGWAVVVDGPGETVMHVDSWMLTGRLVTETTGDGVTITTLLRYDRPVARVVWAALGGIHRAVMPGVLSRSAGALAREEWEHRTGA